MRPIGFLDLLFFLPGVLIYLAVLYILLGIPVARILRRTGQSAWWSLLVVIPLANLVALWVFAFARWPAVDAATRN
ncbi:MAG TPA: hypothetical protein VGQ90_15265 [Stellaceae bacterium]|jgi:uncharacterized membrane protein YhaH (DUF805 family)|nr:hypothetical protein [Stellaceae bacterium]